MLPCWSVSPSSRHAWAARPRPPATPAYRPRRGASPTRTGGAGPPAARADRARTRAALATPRDARGHLQQQGGLADPRLAAQEHHRSGDEPAAEHPVELGDPGRDPCSLLDLDLDEPQRSSRRRGSCSSRRSDGLLDERAEGGAARALAEPAPGAVTALRAAELNGCRLRHAASLRPSPDASLTESARLRAEFAGRADGVPQHSGGPAEGAAA